MKNGWVSLAAILVSALPLRADHRVVLVPSLEITEVNDDNLNYSPFEPISDRVRRVTPALALRVDSPRWSARISGGIDSEQYANQRKLDDDRARERAAVAFRYAATPRLSLTLDGSYLGTNTVADLNSDTALAGLRIRGRRFSAGSSAEFRLSPTMTLSASGSSTTTSVVNGFGTRSRGQSLGLQRRTSPRDSVSFSYERAAVEFLSSDSTSHVMRTQAFHAAWTHDLGLRDRFSIHIGPRVTDGSRSGDMGASLTHQWRASSVAISLLRSQTTVIGYAKNAQTDSVQTAFSYSPIHKLSLYASPAVFHTSGGELLGTVCRLSGGARYAITSFLTADVAYNRDRQSGTLDPLLPNANLSHSTVTIGLTTHWNDRDPMR